MNKLLYLLPIILLLTGCTTPKPALTSQAVLETWTTTNQEVIIESTNSNNFEKILFNTWDIILEEKVSILLYDYNSSNLLSLNDKSVSNFIPEWYRVLWEYDDFPEYLILQKDLTLYSYTISDWATQEIETSSIDEKNNITVYPSISESNEFYIHIVNWYIVDWMLSYQSKETLEYFYDAKTNIAEPRKVKPTINIYDNLLYYLHDSSWEIYDSANDIFFSWVQWQWKSIPIKRYNHKNHSTQLIFDVSRDSEAEKRRFPHFSYSHWNFVITESTIWSWSSTKVLSIPSSNTENMKEFVVSNTLPVDIVWWEWIFTQEDKTFIVWWWDITLLLENNLQPPILLEFHNRAKFVDTHSISQYKNLLLYKRDGYIKMIDIDSWAVNTIKLQEVNRISEYTRSILLSK